MNPISQIRKHYSPVQPTIKSSDKGVTYQEFLPHPQLHGFIHCYWQLKTNGTLEAPFNYRVVADGCIDIFLELNNPSQNWVMGFCKKYTEFPLDNSFDYVGIRFLPTMFPQLFNIDASDLSNRFEQLSLVVPKVSRFISTQLNAAQDRQEIKSRLDDFFCDLISKTDFHWDRRLYNAIRLILENQGMLNLGTGLDTGISLRQLRRLFKHYIGDTPKTFGQVVRFQNILRAKPSNQSLRENKLFYDIGYYDQSHFIKDFKTFYGVTPSRAFGR